MKKLTVLLFVLSLAAFPAVAQGCDGEGHSSDHASACPMKGKKIVGSSEVELTGKLVCMHCNLHKEDSCRKVFQSSSDQALIELCPSGDLKSAEAISEHGEALLLVSGKLVKAEDGSAILEIKTVKKADEPKS